MVATFLSRTPFPASGDMLLSWTSSRCNLLTYRKSTNVSIGSPGSWDRGLSSDHLYENQDINEELEVNKHPAPLPSEIGALSRSIRNPNPIANIKLSSASPATILIAWIAPSVPKICKHVYKPASAISNTTRSNKAAAGTAEHDVSTRCSSTHKMTRQRLRPH